jgi:hypothetical protein
VLRANSPRRCDALRERTWSDCHRMAQRKTSVTAIEELKALIEEANS